MGGAVRAHRLVMIECPLITADLMLDEWERKKLLILGMTYPHYSSKYTENVCTGALIDGTFEMARIHPIPRRYMETDQQFKSFQWIEADVAKHANDPRPESLRIRPDTITLGEHLTAADHPERRRLLDRSPHLCLSVEELRDRYDQRRTSLGIVKPKAVTGVRLARKARDEEADWLQKEKELLAQQGLFERPPKPIDYIPVRFAVSWTCDDSRCSGHEMSLLQWGLHELYRKYRGQPGGDAKVLDAMKSKMNQDKYDLYFFLGSFRGTMYNFGLMDAYSCPRERQSTLFG